MIDENIGKLQAELKQIGAMPGGSRYLATLTSGANPLVPGWLAASVLQELATQSRPMAPLQQTQQPPVIQQVTRQAQANEQGVASIPTPPTMLTQQGFAGGGIVALNGEDEDYGSVVPSEDDPYADYRVVPVAETEAEPRRKTLAERAQENRARENARIQQEAAQKRQEEQKRAEEAAAGMEEYRQRGIDPEVAVRPYFLPFGAPTPAAPTPATSAASAQVPPDIPKGRFVGEPVDVLAQLNSIENPQYRAEAIAQYTRQLQDQRSQPSAEEIARRANITEVPTGASRGLPNSLTTLMESIGQEARQARERVTDRFTPTPDEQARIDAARARQVRLTGIAENAFTSLDAGLSAEGSRYADEVMKQREAALTPYNQAVQAAIAARQQQAEENRPLALGLAGLRAGAAMLGSRSPRFVEGLSKGITAGSDSLEQYLANKAKEDQAINDMRLTHAKMIAEAKRGDIMAVENLKNQLRDDQRAQTTAKINAAISLANAAGLDGERVVNNVLKEAKTLADFASKLSQLEANLEKIVREYAAIAAKTNATKPPTLSPNTLKVAEAVQEFVNAPAPNSILWQYVPGSPEDIKNLKKYFESNNTKAQGLDLLRKKSGEIMRNYLRALMDVQASSGTAPSITDVQ